MNASPAVLVALLIGPMLATLAFGLVWRGREPLWIAAVTGAIAASIIYTIVFVGIGISEGHIRDPADLKFIGVPFIFSFWITFPGALFCAGLMSLWARRSDGWRRTEASEDEEW